MNQKRKAWNAFTAIVPRAAMLAAGIALSGPAAAQTVKVGAILTYSGPQASLGDQIDKGLSLYIKEHEKELPAGEE